MNKQQSVLDMVPFLKGFNDFLMDFPTKKLNHKSYEFGNEEFSAFINNYLTSLAENAKNYINNLTAERQFIVLNKTNIDHVDFLNWYNKEVHKHINGYCKYIVSLFAERPDFELTPNLEQEICANFTEWKLEFPLDTIHHEKLNTTQPIQREDKKIANVENKGASLFTNNFNDLSSQEVFDYFNTALVPNYLSKEDLLNYLQLAFDQQIIPESKFFFLNNPQSNRIIGIFHKFYSRYSKNKMKDKFKYISLLGDYFNPYDSKKIKNNFESYPKKEIQ